MPAVRCYAASASSNAHSGQSFGFKAYSAPRENQIESVTRQTPFNKSINAVSPKDSLNCDRYVDKRQATIGTRVVATTSGKSDFLAAPRKDQPFGGVSPDLMQLQVMREQDPYGMTEHAKHEGWNSKSLYLQFP
jgi:hypothetical protein